MTQTKRNVPAHRRGGQPPVDRKARPKGVTLDSWAGRVRVEWDPEAPLTPLGQASFFIEFLKASGVFDALVADCPLDYASPNAPNKRDVLGTAVLSMLPGHKRYAQIAGLRADGVLPELLGLTGVMSEDAVRRGLRAIPEARGIGWLSGHLDYCTAPLLSECWVLDADTTIKPLYGHQEGAELGYNPKKPGRPSHVYHSYMLANVRLVLDVEVMPGNKHTSNYSAPGLWAILDRIGRDSWPTLLRGDKSFTSDALMSECEGRPSLFSISLPATGYLLVPSVIAGEDVAPLRLSERSKRLPVYVEGRVGSFVSRVGRGTRCAISKPAILVALLVVRSSCSPRALAQVNKQSPIPQHQHLPGR